MNTILLVASAHSYRTAAYQRVARERGINLLLAAPATASAIDLPGRGIRYDRDHPDLEAICRAAIEQGSVQAVVAVDDEVVDLAPRIAHKLGLACNPAHATRLTQRKDLGRQRQHQCGVNAPVSRVIRLDQPLADQVSHVRYPCVIKPLSLSASRGVIRANNLAELDVASRRVHRLLHREITGPDCDRALVEDFLPGREIAVEGFVTHGRFDALVIFDKPEPLNGPFFEETYYVTPAQDVDVDAVAELIQATVDAYGLVTGPVHAECRINQRGVWLLELAARTIGGDCAQMFEFATGESLEGLVLSQALGQTLSLSAPSGACGVLMLPVPGAGGILRRVEGLSQARQVPFVDRVQIDLREGAHLTPWPEGGSYPGFIFARGPTPKCVEAALREAHRCLTFVLAPTLRVRVGDSNVRLGYS